MNILDSTLKKRLVTSILSAVAFVVGIIMIILGAGRNTIVTIIGIILTAFDFYACPLLFVSYNSLVSLRRTVKAVNEENIYSVQKIATHTIKKPAIVKQEITKAIEKGYIIGLLFDGETLSFNENKKANHTLLIAKCPNCGANVNYYSDETPICQYCGIALEEKK